jgi:hypothetical protein
MIKERRYATPPWECGGADIHNADKVEAALRYHEGVPARPVQPAKSAEDRLGRCPDPRCLLRALATHAR